MDAKGQLLLQSTGFASPKEAGQTIAQLQTSGTNALTENPTHLVIKADLETVSLALRYFSEATN
jgi:tryptophanyl-tRNA synthetase